MDRQGAAAEPQQLKTARTAGVPSIVFVAESALGMDPPALDVLPVPEPAATWLQTAAAASVLTAARRSAAARRRSGQRPTTASGDRTRA